MFIRSHVLIYAFVIIFICYGLCGCSANPVVPPGENPDCNPDDNNAWNDPAVPGIGFGNEILKQTVCIPSDKEDWYKFTTNGNLAGTLQLEVTNNTGEATISLFSEEESGSGDNPIAWKTANPQNFDPYGTINFETDLSEQLQPGTYYVRIRHIGTDFEIREYKFTNAGVEGPPEKCYPDNNNDYLSAVTVGFGQNSGVHTICNPDDRVDWYKFKALGELTGFLNLAVTNQAGPVSMTLYDEVQAPLGLSYIAYAEAVAPDYQASIDLGAISLQPGAGTYYVQIEYLGEDLEPRGCMFENNADDTSKKGWVHIWEGSFQSINSTVADGDGNTYLAGLFQGTIDLDPGPGVYERTSIGETDVFLSKFDSSGTFLWGRTWGGEDSEYDPKVAVDGANNSYVSNTGDVQYSKYNATLIKFNSFGDVLWERFWSGYGLVISGIAVVEDYNIYMAGYFRYTINFGPGSGGDHTAFGDYDIFLCKVNPDSEFGWGKTWGGNNYDVGYAVAVDGANNVYITGQYSSYMDFNPNPGIELHTGAAGTFLSKFASNGDYYWTATWGAAFGKGLAVDENDNIYIAGSFVGSPDFAYGPILDIHKANGKSDIYLTKYSSDGGFQWARTWGGDDEDYNDRSIGMTRTGDNSILITGVFAEVADFDPGQRIEEYASNGEEDIFLSKFDNSGSFQWARTWGGIYDDSPGGVSVDGEGNIFLAGYFMSPVVDIDPGPGIENYEFSGGKSGFLMKLRSNGYWQFYE